MAQSMLQPNAEPIAGYKLRRYLGRGGFGEVWEAEAPGGLSKAVKIAPVETDSEGVTCRELDGLKKIRWVRHPYLLSIERFEIIDRFLVIVMELADRSLADRFNECVASGLPGIPRDELLGYLREASEVLDLLNERHGLQHLDIKPENLFLSSGHVKVADFGLVQPRGTNLSRSTIAISPPYAPPELFDGRIEPTADQYSLAVTYQELLTGGRPYVGQDVRSLILQHLKGRPDLSALPPSDRSIISKALQRDPDARFATCTELVRGLTDATHVHGLSIPVEGVPREPISSSGLIKIDSTSLPPADRLARPHYVRARVVKDTERMVADTESVTRGNIPLPVGKDGTEQQSAEKVEATFVAFLPIKIFAHKLRGFIDAMEADVIRCSNEQTVLYIGPHGWFRRSTPRGMFLVVETYTRNPHSGYRVVDVMVWSAGRRLPTSELGWRGMLLIRCLKYYLMATENSEAQRFRTDAEVLAAVLS